MGDSPPDRSECPSDQGRELRVTFRLRDRAHNQLQSQGSTNPGETTIEAGDGEKGTQRIDSEEETDNQSVASSYGLTDVLSGCQLDKNSEELLLMCDDDEDMNNVTVIEKDPEDIAD